MSTHISKANVIKCWNKFHCFPRLKVPPFLIWTSFFYSKYTCIHVKSRTFPSNGHRYWSMADPDSKLGCEYCRCPNRKWFSHLPTTTLSLFLSGPIGSVLYRKYLSNYQLTGNASSSACVAVDVFILEAIQDGANCSLGEQRPVNVAEKESVLKTKHTQLMVLVLLSNCFRHEKRNLWK